MAEAAWSAEQCARLLEKAKQTPNGWKACCPAHDDRNPSLFLADGQDGLALVCYAGCGYRAICEALEAKGAALKGHRSLDIPTEHFQLGAYHSHWDYRDAAGRLIMRVCRWEQPAGRKDIRPLIRTEDGWKWAHHPTPRPLWQLERFANEPEAPVLIVEGEKTAAAAQKLFPDYIATTWPAGAQAMGLADWSPLDGREAVLVPDCDAAGRKAMAWVENHLKGLARSLRVVDPAQWAKGLPEGWDLADAWSEKRDVSGWLAPPDPDVQRRAVRLNWIALDARILPERQWAIEHWIPMGHVTLLAGAGGTGKSLIAQALGSCLALQREYLDYPPAPRRVLFWACEDSHDELWRRQVAIAKWLGVSLGAFAQSFLVHSYEREQIELALQREGQLESTANLLELRAQIGDYKAEVVVLDNIARLYAGNENDRHQVTSFIAMLSAAAAPTNAAVILLGHPSKANGSEYSGSTAWEGAVRARLYLGRTLPGVAEPDSQSHVPIDDGSRYLCRRKANYSDQDVRKLLYDEGVMKAEAPRETRPRGSLSPQFVQEAVVAAMRKLSVLGEPVTSSNASPAFLPKLAERYGLLGGCSRSQFTQAMSQLQLSGTLVRQKIGTYANSTPKFGLTLADGASPVLTN